jgi:hypothetical protein
MSRREPWRERSHQYAALGLSAPSEGFPPNASRRFTWNSHGGCLITGIIDARTLQRPRFYGARTSPRFANRTVTPDAV